ncbi:MAG: insulinase family protein, partial [Mycobacterium sp.]
MPRPSVAKPVGFRGQRTAASAPELSAMRRTVLPGGLRVVTELVPSVRSASVGVWVN